MKKAAITLAVLLTLSLCLMVSASAIIGGTATEVSFTQENVVGDPASAEGFSVQSLFTLKGHAHWDTTLTLGKNPTWNTDFSYTTTAKAMSYTPEPYVVLYGASYFSVYGNDINTKEYLALTPFTEVLEEMAQEAPANAWGYTRTFPLTEVMDYYPLALDSSGTVFPLDTRQSLEITSILTRLFHVPANGYQVTLTISTDSDKNLTSIDFYIPDDNPNVHCPGVSAGNCLYLAFSPTDSLTGETIPGCAPPGVYRIPILNPDSSPTLDEENARLLSALPENVYLLDKMDNGQDIFFLANNPEGDVEGGWIDAASGEIMQIFQESEDFSDATVFTEENHVVILSRLTENAIPQRASVWVKDSHGQYQKMIDADISQATFSDCRSIRTLYDEAENRLLIAGFQNTYVSPSLQVAVCQKNTMTYAATFISSQDELRKTTFFQAEEEFPQLHLVQAQ